MEGAAGGRPESAYNHVHAVDDEKTVSRKGLCFRCGRWGHYSGDPSCPAGDKHCNRCHGIGHFEKCARVEGTDLAVVVGRRVVIVQRMVLRVVVIDRVVVLRETGIVRSRHTI
jgi:hypothetical protein